MSSDDTDARPGPIDLAGAPPFQLGPLALSPARREVCVAGGAPQGVQPRVMQVLIALAEARGGVVSRDVLVARCWAGLNLSEDAVQKAVAKARQVAELVHPPAFEIEAVPRVGYRLIASGAPDIPADPAFAPRRRGLPGRIGLGVVAGLLVLGVGVGAVVWTPRFRGPAVASDAPPLKVGVAPFEVLGASTPELRRVADGLRAEIIDQLNRADVGVVDAQGAAPYAFGGAVERDGQGLVIRLRLDDRRQHVTVWSDEVRNSTRKTDALQLEAANVVAHAATIATQEDALAKGDPETLGLLIRRTFYALRNSDETREAEWADNQRLLAKLPDVASVHANFAIVSGFLAATTASPERAARLRAMATAEVAAALRLDPKSDEAYLARYLLIPAVGHWGEREAVLRDGLKAAPQSELLTNHYANFLLEVGRLDEAVEWARRAASVTPPSANRDATLLLALATSERTGEADPLADRIRDAYPEHDAAWNARFEALLFRQRWAEAEALLAPSADRSGMDEAERRAWTLALRAMRSGGTSERRKAVAAFLARRPPGAAAIHPPHETYEPGERIAMVAMLGDTDEAFALASSYLRREASADSAFLFWPTTAAIRRDARFRPLMTKIGLTDYWRSRGR